MIEEFIRAEKESVISCLGENSRLVSVVNVQGLREGIEDPNSIMVTRGSIDPQDPNCWSIIVEKDSQNFTIVRSPQGDLQVVTEENNVVPFDGDSEFAQAIFNQIGVRTPNPLEASALASIGMLTSPTERSRRDLLKIVGILATFVGLTCCTFGGSGNYEPTIVVNGTAVPTKVETVVTPSPESSPVQRAELIAKTELWQILPSLSSEINAINVKFVNRDEYIALAREDGIIIPDGYESSFLEESDAKLLTNLRVIVINRDAPTFTTQMEGFSTETEKDNFLTRLLTHVIKHEVSHGVSETKPVSDELKRAVAENPLTNAFTAITTFGYSIGLDGGYQLSGLEEVVVTHFNTLNCGSTCVIDQISLSYIGTEMIEPVNTFLANTLDVEAGSFVNYVIHKATDGIDGLIDRLVIRYNCVSGIDRRGITKMVLDFVVATTFAHTSYLYWRKLSNGDATQREDADQYKERYDLFIKTMNDIATAVKNRSTEYTPLANNSRTFMANLISGYSSSAHKLTMRS